MSKSKNFLVRVHELTLAGSFFFGFSSAPMMANQDLLDKILTKLTRRPMSTREVSEWLEEKGAAPEVKSTIIEKLRTWKYLDDLRLLASLVRTELRRGKALNTIRQKAWARGLNAGEAKYHFDTVYEEGLREVRSESISPVESTDSREAESSEEIETQRAQQLVGKRFQKDLGDMKVRKRAFDFLIRRGFPASVAARAVQALLKNKTLLH